MSFALSTFMVRACVPLPSGPTARRLPRSWAVLVFLGRGSISQGVDVETGKSRSVPLPDKAADVRVGG
jgi:hypothetical protein